MHPLFDSARENSRDGARRVPSAVGCRRMKTHKIACCL